MQWYYAEDGEQRGPFADADFVKMVEKGSVGSSTPVWNETMTDWLPCRDVREEIDQIAREIKGVSAGMRADSVTCAECNGQFSRDEVISYKGSYVCGDCKQAFFQRIEEGGAFLRGEGGIGDTPNAEITAKAREALQGNWGIAIGFYVLYYIMMQVISGVIQIPAFMAQAMRSPERPIALILTVLPFLYFLVGVLQVGANRFFLDLVRGELQGIGRLFFGFKYFWKAGGTYLLMMLRVLLWTLLFIIPGIVAGLSYSMAFYVLVDNPGLTPSQILARSKRMMIGNRWKLVFLSFRFLGWSILALFTCGIGFLWLYPYMTTAYAEFYEDVRGIE